MHSSAVLRGAVSVLGLLVLWEWLGRNLFVAAVLPAPSVVLEAALQRAGSGLLVRDVVMSLSRLLIGFAAGSLLGTILGLLLGSIAWLRRSLEPVVQFFRFIPPIAWLTPVLIWFGIGEMGKYVLITYTTTFMVLLNTLAGLATPQRNRIRAAQCFGARAGRVFLHVRLPMTLPYILAGMRIGMGNSFQTLIVAEMLAANEGVGFLIMNSRTQLATEGVFVGLVAVAILGLACDAVFRVMTRRLAWRFQLGW
ncbi:ABC transporter permease [Belnapia rosea]|uniref:ABC transporter permease n=1 Tax=Belnapia rosea TaxID=938405 RepID=UPI00088FA8C1|nr:ABC transporter permease [Belnapia rosea]SDB74400.1 NitT/TauT family transport system permease protein [Belnapia rosea]